MTVLYCSVLYLSISLSIAVSVSPSVSVCLSVCLSVSLFLSPPSLSLSPDLNAGKPVYYVGRTSLTMDFVSHQDIALSLMLCPKPPPPSPVCGVNGVGIHTGGLPDWPMSRTWPSPPEVLYWPRWGLVWK